MESALPLTFFASSVICGLALILLAIVSYWAGKRWLIPFMLANTSMRISLAGIEVVFALLATATANTFDLFKTTTWENRTADTAWHAALFLFIAIAYIICKVLQAFAKEKDTKTIADLRTELSSEQKTSTAKILALENQRSWTVRISQLITNIMNEKAKRIRRAFESPQAVFSAQNFVDAIKPNDQVLRILTVFHATLTQSPSPPRRLRLAVYLLDDGYLTPVYSFDGEEVNCFSHTSREHMKVINPDGAGSVITQLYHGAAKFRLIEDCETASHRGEFEFLRVEQKSYLKSMFAAKRTVHFPSGKNVIILALDTDQAGFFKQENQIELESYCEEVLKRLDFELLCLDIISNIPRSVTP